MIRPTYNKFVMLMKAKEKMIEHKINKYCKLIKINKTTMKSKINQLKLQEAKLVEAKEFRMKSKIQSYDIRDCDQFYGILELEKLLKKSTDLNMEKFADGIRRSNASISQALH